MNYGGKGFFFYNLSKFVSRNTICCQCFGLLDYLPFFVRIQFVCITLLGEFGMAVRLWVRHGLEGAQGNDIVPRTTKVALAAVYQVGACCLDTG